MKDKKNYDLEKVPDSAVIKQLRQDLGKANAYIEELKDDLNTVRSTTSSRALTEKNGRIKNLEKTLKKYRTMKLIKLGNDNDLNHWCSYNGITGENKKELTSIILSTIAGIETE